jgi:hypothetical protein
MLSLAWRHLPEILLDPLPRPLDFGNFQGTFAVRNPDEASRRHSRAFMQRMIAQ